MSQHSDASACDLTGIREILRRWDPIGVIPDAIADGLPPDEYDDYAAWIYRLLSSRSSVDEIANHLEYCRTKAIGLASDRAADMRFARELVEWWNER